MKKLLLLMSLFVNAYAQQEPRTGDLVVECKSKLHYVAYHKCAFGFCKQSSYSGQLGELVVNFYEQGDEVYTSKDYLITGFKFFKNHAVLIVDGEKLDVKPCRYYK